MHDDANTKSIDIELINGLLFVIGDYFRGNEAWGSAFREDYIFLAVESSEPVVNYFEAVDSIIYVK